MLNVLWNKSHPLKLPFYQVTCGKKPQRPLRSIVSPRWTLFAKVCGQQHLKTFTLFYTLWPLNVWTIRPCRATSLFTTIFHCKQLNNRIFRPLRVLLTHWFTRSCPFMMSFSFSSTQVNQDSTKNSSGDEDSAGLDLHPDLKCGHNFSRCHEFSFLMFALKMFLHFKMF